MINNFFDKKSKADVIETLKNEKIKFNIPKTISFTLNDWKKSKKLILKKIQLIFYKNKKLAIRSSSQSEDGLNESMAGKFVSHLNVPTNNKKIVLTAINSVIKSYSKTSRSNDQVLIQEMVGDINSSGVIFTRDIETGADYYVINYDDVTGKTNTVTSGLGNHSNRILYIHKRGAKKLKSKRFKKLIAFTKTLEKKIGLDSLDIEFAINKKLEIFLLQVRPISTTLKWNSQIDKKIDLKISISEKKIDKIFKRNKNVIGSNTIFGNMPDWNPVEIIGKHPSKLSVSLYKYLITDNIWAKARSLIGYKDLTGHKLMHIICGQSFIDTRLSLNYFLPKNLKKDVSKKIINHGINILKKYPFLHDKIEFEISMPSFHFSANQKIERLFGKVLKKKEKKILVDEIKLLTKNLLENDGNFSQSDCINKIEALNKNFDKVSKYKIDNLDYIINQCRDVGTLCFSILARHGFVARGFLNSLEEQNILSVKQKDKFEQSLNTIMFEMLNDSYLARFNKNKQKIFMTKYGHLRPGTYDITSKRYDQMKNFKFNNDKLKKINFNLNISQKNQIDLLLKKNNFDLNSSQFIKYIKDSLIMREYSKFVFTKYLSLTLEIIANFAKSKKTSRKEISKININFFLNKNYKILNRSKIIKLIVSGDNDSDIYKSIKLPSLIMDKSNLRIVPYQVNVPNFITKKKVYGEYIYLKPNKPFKKLDNKIIVIENADPGYDWIFNYKILGLITKNGGINSHMGIRCSELSLPAIIGCGEQLFSEVISKKEIFIDCSNSSIY